ncbi:uncharacterized protein LOC132066797 [Lycium ferocissimum]|uniref:uncharacterized protein LOC132066797 n=1 Tax=Lycium ferocissimum TaxID=112874 RepID=UPI002815CE6A|nr:uncharacterized protein LOC132066797 [Lycium ferocissimum]
MGRTRMPSFCLNRIRPHVQIRSPPIQANNINENFAKKVEGDDHEEKNDTSSAMSEEKNAGDIAKPAPLIGRKIMILVDSSLEAKNALQWALTHTVQSHDLLVLLYVTKPSKQDEESKNEISPRIFEFLASLKNTCKLKRPEVQVEVAVAQGKEKGPIIVEEAKKQEVSLLILGQKKRSMTWRLIMMWAGGRVVAGGGGGGGGGGGVVEYCIQNASCMAIAVRRKSKKLGGYLITTKRQKDFWLLA